MILRTLAHAALWLAIAGFSSPSLAECKPDDMAGPACAYMDSITIFGSADAADEVAGGASLITPEDLERFEATSVVQALRQVPGIAVQLEDGYGLRPNISIRGTATERSSRITLMEDGVLIAPAPYSAPAAYYFPTFGRINSVEVLKGPASITQGPYTVGGAVNLRTTPIPEVNSGYLQAEYGSDATWHVHGWYGGGNNQARYLAETYQWQSDGYQAIDRSDKPTGLDKQDYLGKLAFSSEPGAALSQSLELKLQYSEEESQQSYLGLTDSDFDGNPLRRYGLSVYDEMYNEHEQLVLSWQLENQAGDGLNITAYRNNFERAWYKTEGIDFDGSADPGSFRGTGWSNVISAINRNVNLGGFTPAELQAILAGADTPGGSVQVRSNSRDYYSQGVQMLADTTARLGSVTHDLQLGIRYHEDEEDRLQRNDTYQQLGGKLLLNALGLEGNAGNELANAKAWAAYAYDRIELERWTFTPGLRYEHIELSRTRYFTNGADPSSRADSNFRDYRENTVTVWLPGMGGIFALDTATSLVGGVHRGFATPGNEPGVEPEESTNYELGVRHARDRINLEAMLFFNDYQNLVGVCTNSSGSNCEPGEAFSGQGVHIPGLELSAQATLDASADWQVPLQVTYTWMNAEFQSNFVSEFFGPVQKGDPVPYVPHHQLWASVGLTGGPWAFYLSANFTGSVCTKASCGPFEETGDSTLFDLSTHYQVNDQWQLYAVIENLGDEVYLVAREPYGARPNKPRTLAAGVSFSF